MNTTGAPIELELKLAVRPQDADRLAAHPLIARHAGGAAQTQLMLAHYLDTPERALAAAGMALRLRREGRQWRQTLKTSGGEALALRARGEWEHALPAARLDWAALRRTPLAALPAYAGRAGWKALAADLKPVFTTRFQRRNWALALPGGTQAVLSLDQGHIACGRGARRRTVPICELELECQAGDPARLWKFAAELAKEWPLIPLAASKAERGHELAAQARPAPHKGKPPKLARTGGVPQALAAALGAPLAALQHNLRHLDAADPEFVHQARVALRRLRSVLRAFGPLPGLKGLGRPITGLDAPLRALGQVLGAARDADVFELQTLPAWREALPAALAGELDRLAPQAAQVRRETQAAAAALAASAAYGQTLLRAERLVFDAAAAPHGGGALEPLARRLLGASHERVWRAARGLTRLTAAQRHRLRIDVKRLRYGLDLWSSLWPEAATRPYRQALAGLQDELGALNDAAVAGQTLAALGASAALRKACAARERSLLAQRLPLAAQTLAALDLCAAPWR
ncbi:CYTH and CHAD domain-containing protein [Variovorax terrae]|uniref:CHAD domain-containing protein n=1 Tax=Variovorax terrae TaxID=2923278 RepID=A0A9X1VR02_9BURK|nr:CYTH and CHAD domain-containing protein [Variovorax terrae]MCJ0762226.1 CHAD domain-containing protein [Variovorax terrae]